MRLEHAFFTAALSQGMEGSFEGASRHSRRRHLLPSLLVVDFDETLTLRDTTGLVIAAAAEAATARGDAEGRRRMEETAAGLVKRYAEEREELFRRELPASPPPSFDPSAAASFLSKLSAFDREANARAFDSGILAGIPKGSLRDLGRKGGSSIQGDGGEGRGEGGGLLRPGAAAALEAALELGVPARVLSVSWSSELISGALSAALEGSDGGGRETPEVSCDEASWGLSGEGGRARAAVVVAANDLEYGGGAPSSPALSKGSVARRVECADDKLSLFSELVASLPRERGGGGEGVVVGPVVFVGDSPSDLGALLAADVGVALGDGWPSPTGIRRVAEALGVRVAPISEASPAFESPDGREAGDDAGGATRDAGKTIYEARSWDEVSRLLFPPRAPPPPSGEKGGPSLSPARPRPAIPRVLTIAGSDSGGGAGIQADVKAASALGAFSSTAVTAVTVQNSRGVLGVHRVPSDVVRAQAEAVLSDLGADAVKTGMIPDAETVEAVAAVVEAWRSGGGGGGKGSRSDDGGTTAVDHRRYPLVVDPVLVSTSGDALAEGGVARALAERLFPLATVVTPNLPEAAALLSLLEGGDGRGRGTSPERREDLGSVEGAADAARRLSAFGSAWVLVKGGHADASPAGPGLDDEAAGASPAGPERGAEAVDVLYESSTGELTYLRAPRVDTLVSHGTGCTLASSIACGLARGLGVAEASRAAKRYVSGALTSSAPMRLGRGPQFPMNHGYSTSACDWARGDGLRVAGDEEAEDRAGDGCGGGTPPPPPSADYRLYVVTDPRLVSPGEMRSRVAAAARGGATVVQVRDKGAGPGELLESALEALRGAELGAASSPSPSSRPPLVVVNDRVDVAAGAPGVSGAHVGQGDLPAPAARRVLGHTRLLGVSVRTPRQALEAVGEGADYVGAGAVFPTGTKDDAEVIGLRGLAEIASAVPPGFPVVAIGGVTAENAAEAILAGASGVAVVSAVFGKGDSGEEDVERAARALREAVDAALAERRRRRE